MYIIFIFVYVFKFVCIHVCVCVLCIIFEPYNFHFWHERATKKKAELGIASAAVSGAWAAWTLDDRRDDWLIAKSSLQKNIYSRCSNATPTIWVESNQFSKLDFLWNIRDSRTIRYLLGLKVTMVPQGWGFTLCGKNSSRPFPGRRHLDVLSLASAWAKHTSRRLVDDQLVRKHNFL